MKILLIGSGGREHALAWKLGQAPSTEKLYALPGSDAMGELAENIPGDPLDASATADTAQRLGCELTVIGPEAPLAAGIVDEFRRRGLAIFGPTRGAAQLETSKIFAKQFMQRHAIPTARFHASHELQDARRALREFTLPLVLKADGLAAGKGVVIAQSEREAEQAVEAMFSGRLVGSAGSAVVIEECLGGEELSFLALADGSHALPLVPAQDHKRLFDGDHGPNTGGMGAYSADDLLTAPTRAEIETKVLRSTLAGMQAEGIPFSGVLYCGLMLTDAGPQVLEFNARFGDPETQTIMLRFEGDLTRALYSTATGKLDGSAVRWSREASACVVLASGGYPGKYATGKAIEGLERAAAEPSVTIFHAGTRRKQGRWETAGGRVLSVCARAASLANALARCYRAIEHIHFEGIQYRKDIGWRALARGAPTAVQRPAAG